MVLLLDVGENRFDRDERQAEPARQLGAGQLAGEMQRLQNELGDEIAAETRLFQVLGALAS